MNYKHLQGWMILVLIGGSVLAFSSTPYHPKHSIYNEGELGASELRKGLESFNISISRLLISPIILNASDDIEVIIIIGSERKYSSAEVNAYEGFVNRGGILFIFEDFGPAKKIANKMGIIFLPGILRETSEELQINRPTQFFVQDLLISQFLEGTSLPPLLVSEAVSPVDVIGFIDGSTLPILMTYPTAFLDVNNNNVMETTDLRSPLGMPVGLIKLYGNGTLLVIGDAGLPLNRYWQKTVTLQGQEFVLTNAIWTILIISVLMNTYGKSAIVFDESHQEVILNSAAGIFNLLAGTWVSIWNTIEVTLILVLVTAGFTSSRVRSKLKLRYRFKRKRDTNIKLVEDQTFVSNPSHAEGAIAQQFILFQVMEDNFIQVANSNLIGKIKSTGKADLFLEEIRQKYGISDLSHPMPFDKLLSLHNDLRMYVDENSPKWL